MTKSQIAHKKHILKNIPLNASRYVGFYLTMLVLSTVGTSLGIFGLFSIPETIRQFDLSPFYAIASLFNILIILPVSIWALVLLWLKRPLGIWLKLGAYAASIISSIGLLLSSGPIINELTAKALVEVAKSSQQVSSSLVEGFASFAFYVGLSLTIIVSIVFGLLWWFAWKKQIEADSE